MQITNLTALGKALPLLKIAVIQEMEAGGNAFFAHSAFSHFFHLGFNVIPYYLCGYVAFIISF
ncbi:hypothetical protein CHU_2827 [Cytophaga hutchinsonii ATCC 33406]|uniref:Uncharacterized protein n=1 Tax=Cytophaga hutchinsonii (strain ATCC 33406 / DSM 1761 / CIP 103989 / NBRC 15051 / NCIMB 9469 / D465) TaxID=269798 RepID=A0A6N4SUZ9_CYTH3|nr:hypothetical protein CHU_2827 [Cytophaga hutchinsonii ATCC 33406]